MRARLVEESINFERTSNPLSSMGLGGFSFDTLQPGAIIQSKRYFGVTEKTGNITGYHSGKTKIGRGNYLLITEVRKTSNPETKNLYFHRYIDLETAKKEKEKFKEGGTRTLSWWGIPRGFFSSMTRSKFDYRFDIIEPGFSIEESINFQRGMDPKASIGIGGYSFDTLRNGTIIKCIKPFGTSKGGVIRAYQGSAKRIPRETYLVIFNIRKLDSYYISFEYINAGGVGWYHEGEERTRKDLEYFDRAKGIKKLYLEGDPYIESSKKYSGGSIAKIGREKFNNLFKIIETP